MNKLMMLAVAATLTLGGCATQKTPTSGPYEGRRYEPRYDDRRPDRYGDNRYENDRLEEQLERYANDLNLSRSQIRDIQKIQDKYERRGLTRAERNNREAYMRIQREKRREMMAVLTPAQRDRLYQINRDRRMYDRRG